MKPRGELEDGELVLGRTAVDVNIAQHVVLAARLPLEIKTERRASDAVRSLAVDQVFALNLLQATIFVPQRHL